MSGIRLGADGIARCAWVGDDAEYERYHDEEWGVPQHDARALFEKMCLEGFQAGLSWITILRRREAFRRAFHGFDPEQVAVMNESDVDRLVEDASIIRHRGKITATISNAQSFLNLPRPLNEIVWAYSDTRRRERPRTHADVPAITDASTSLSRELRGLGFRFVGPTTMYALMQACGVVDDHLVGCSRAR